MAKLINCIRAAQNFVSAVFQHFVSNLKLNLDRDSFRIAQNVKHKSYISVSCLSISSWINSIGARTKTLCPKFGRVSNLPEFPFFLFNPSYLDIFLIQQPTCFGASFQATFCSTHSNWWWASLPQWCHVVSSTIFCPLSINNVRLRRRRLCSARRQEEEEQWRERRIRNSQQACPLLLLLESLSSISEIVSSAVSSHQIIYIHIHAWC